MKNNKGITLTSLVIYIAVVFVVIAALTRITTHFSNNMKDAADVAFETEFQKINLYLLDETKKSGNAILEITEEGKQITFEKGNKYTYNAEEKIIYLNEKIKVCEGIENCLFVQKTADNGKTILSLTIKINNIEKMVAYVISEKKISQKPLLPNEYQQVEYIESTGTQYIDTGITCNENLKIEVKYEISSFEADRSYIFGVYGSSNSYRVQYSHTSTIFAGFGNMYNNSITAPTEEKQYVLIMDNGKFTLDGEDIYDATSAGGKFSATNTATIVLFARNGNGSIGNYGSNRIYYLKIWNGETLVRDFIPCYGKSDNVVGLYDVVNNVFYTNAGTGEFEKGENVIVKEDNEDFVNMDDYIWGEIYYLKVGDYVNYTPDIGEYKVAAGTTGSGYDSVQSFTTDNLKWRIYSIDEQRGNIELISETVAQNLTPLYLQGADGYNHGVDILNDLCDKLYSKTVNEKKVATARSINIEDINKKTTFSPQDYKAYGGTPYTPSSKQYPNVYAIELGSTEQGLNATEKLLKGSERIEKSTENSQGITEYTKYTGSSTASTLYSTYTYYQYYPEENLKQNMGINTMPLGVIKTDQEYWMASRYAASSAERVGFGIRKMDAEGMVNRDYLFRSTGGTNSVGYGVRPIVTLNAIDLFDFKIGDGSKEKPWGMKANENNTENGLPVQYQQVEYLQSSGTQYINTRYIPNSNTVIEMKASNTSTTNACLYCARSTGHTNTYTAFLLNGTSLRVDYYNTTYSVGVSATIDTAYVYKQTKNLVYINGELKKTLPEVDFSSEYNMYLMASHNNETGITNIGSFKFYYCKIWDGDTLVRDFIPCYQKSDNVAGLYDVVNNQFYTNAGSGAFTVGADV